jgi:signal recognition particle subunit SRP54
VGLTGLILTKIVVVARGGAAFSIRAVTGVPIKFMGEGERPGDLEMFHPDRLASRILGMGDVLTLIERAQTSLDQEKSQRAGERLLSGEFNLEDFLEQITEIKKMGPLSHLLEMVPGMAGATRDLSPEWTDQQIKQTEAIISSMTRGERRHPKLLNASRKRRVARGSGTDVREVNQLLVQFRQMQRLIKQLSGGKKRGPLNLMDGLGLR